MKAIICGGRDFTNWMAALPELDKIHSKTPITLVIQGGATGADHIAKVWAEDRKIPMVEHKARWRELGKRAGSVRNTFMLEHERPDIVIAMPGGYGTAHMKRISRDADVEVVEICTP